MDLGNIFSQFGISGAKETIYMSITPGVGLELLQLDLSTKTVKNYACKPLEYNESLREIPNLDDFKTAFKELFDELNINIKTNIVLNIPMVLFGNKELPLMLGDDAITEALTSEAEQSYIFKRHEPIVNWVDSSASSSNEMRRLFYSAIQKKVLEDLKNAVSELGANLVGIEISLLSVLKALMFSGLIETQIQDGVSWNLMLVNQTGYSICSMLGKKLIEYYEEPLAVKSFDSEEVYNAINASAQISLMNYPANYLTIVSETDLVSAEILASRLPFDGTVNYIENNQFKKQDILPVSLEVLEEDAHKISLEAIGVATGVSVALPIKFNFLNEQLEAVSDDPDELVHVVLGKYEFDITPNNAMKIALAIGVAIVVPVLAIASILPGIAGQKQKHLDELKNKLDGVQAEVKKYEDNESKSSVFDLNTEIKKVLDNNRSKLMGYIALGESVPKNLWLTYFSAREDGKFDIKGQAQNVEDVYTFYKNMKDSLINTQLRLHKLEMKADSVDEEVSVSSDYEFEITNMSDSELSPKPVEEAKPKTEQTQVQAESEETDTQPAKKPLLNFGKK